MFSNLRLSICILCMAHCCLVFAQQEAWVYLTDKQNVAQSISNPITILTQKAIDRKNAQGIAIDSRDVPVNENYITQLKAQTGIQVMAKSKWFNAVHVRGSEVDINALLALSFVDSIDFANDGLNSRPALVQDNFSIENTLVDFNYGDAQNQVEMLNLDCLHESDYTGEGITIAVLDSGFTNVNTMSSFQRLRDNNDLLDGYDFVDRNADVYNFTGSNHGTKVLSTMAGYIENQYVGTAPDASYYLFRTEDVSSENPVEESYWVEAAERADSLGVDIINTSLGYTVYDNSAYDYSISEMDGNTTYITRGANIAGEKGIIVVVSAGNSGASTWQIVEAPADAPNVLTVGAVDSSGDYASFSSQGSAIQPTQKPDVVAKGSATAVIDENDTIITNNGTSFSSPIIAGSIACLLQAQPFSTVDEISQAVRMSSSQYEFPDYFLGYGIPDFCNALTLLSVPEIDSQDIRIHPNPVSSTLYLNAPEGSPVLVSVTDTLGKRVVEDETLYNNQLDVSQLKSGLYFLNIHSSESHKIIKFIKN